MYNYNDFTEARLRHLELIQGVINRLAGNGFRIKSWSLTLVGVFLGLAVDSGNWGLALASVAPTIVFWGLDGYFLRSERLFRELHGRVAGLDEELEPFFMAATAERFVKTAPTHITDYWETVFRRPVLYVFYSALLVAACLVAAIVFIATRTT